MNEEKLYEEIKKLAKKYPDYLIFTCKRDTTVEELWRRK